MEVRIGWSTDYGHAKFDVTVDEVDLQRMLAEENIDVEPTALTVAETFKLMEAEAKRYSVFAALEFAVMSKEQAVPQLESAVTVRKQRIEALRKRLAKDD